MHLLTLSLANIGPYVDPVTIDFTQLGQDGPFLLEGPTGAGKTTLVDAIVFALYGEMSGRDSDDARLVSTFRAPGATPWVELEIETRRGLYRVRRSPAHTRPKRSGTGVTVENSAVRLWKLAEPGDPGTPLTRRHDEADRELEDAIGLTPEQFTQTVVLPQGDFARFLRTSPEKREDILTKVFGTQIYDALVAAVVETTQRREQETQTARTRWGARATEFASLAWSGDLEPDAATEARGRFGEAMAGEDMTQALLLARDRATGVAEAAGAAEATAARAQRDLDEAQAALRAAEQDNAALARWAALVRERETLEAQADAMAAERATLERATRAERVRHPLTAARGAEEALVATRRRLEDALPGADRVLDTPFEGDATAWLVRVDAQRLTAEQERAEVAAWEQRAAALATEQAALAEDEAALAEDRMAWEEAAATAATREQRVTELAEQQRAAEHEAGQAEAARAAAAAAELLIAAVRERDDLTEQRETARRQVEELTRAALAAAQAYHAAHETWLSGLAAEVAAELSEGEPCPVCGSRDHPAPAQPAPSAVSRQRLGELADAETRADEAVSQARERLAAVDAARKAAAKAAGDTSLVEAEAAHRIASDQVARCEAARGEAMAAASAQADEQARLVALRDDIAARQVRLGRQEGALATRRAVMDTQAQALADHVQDHGPLADQADALSTRAAALAEAADAGRAWDEARRAADARASELTDALAEAGFPDADAATAALLPPDGARSRTSALAAFDDQLIGVQARAAAPDMVRAAELEAVDEAPLRALVTTRQDQAQRAHERVGALTRLADATRDGLARLEADASAVADQWESLRPWSHLRALVQGANNLSMTLPTFVLLRRFDEVLELANERLLTMTAGRYELERTDDREGRARRQGLGLVMVDHEADDARRPTRTLSGGETFLTSLALALGLSDAVTAEAGGIELGTLLVDEGFGSLDAENLDRVMAQLAALRAGGRQVGVISHVEELKGRITDRLTVRPRGGGTSVVTCAVPGVIRPAAETAPLLD